MPRVSASRLPSFPLPVVLMYHSVASPRNGTDLYGLHVEPDHFREQIKLIADYYRIISIQELADRLNRGRLRPNSFVVTFDDGYANNLSRAAPILQEFDAPATLFLCSGFVGRRSFWWEELINAVFTATNKPENFSTISVSLKEAESFLRARLHDLDNSDVRAELVSRIWTVLTSMQFDQMLEVVDAIVDRLRPAGDISELRPMTVDEVTRAACFFNVGAHSVTHPMMTKLELPEVAREALNSKRFCEELAGTSVNSFAYPYGDFDNYVSDEMSRLFAMACTTEERLVKFKTPIWQVPRFQVQNWNLNQFIKKLESWSGQEKSSLLAKLDHWSLAMRRRASRRWGH